MGGVKGYVLVPDTRAICIAESSNYYYRAVAPDKHCTQTQVSYFWYVTAVSGTWYILICTLQQLVPGTALYEYSYELVPAKAIDFRLRTFAPWFLRFGKRNLAGSCVMTMRNDSLLVFLILFERSEFLIATSKKKKTDRLCGCVCVRICFGFSVEKIVLVLV